MRDQHYNNDDPDNQPNTYPPAVSAAGKNIGRFAVWGKKKWFRRILLINKCINLSLISYYYKWSKNPQNKNF